MITSMIVWPLFLVAVVALIALIVAGIRAGESSNGGQEMIKNVYIYLVLFATLMMTIGGSVGAFMAVADIIAPAPYYQQLEEYKYNYYHREGADGEVQLSEEELLQRYQAMVTAHKEQQIDRAKNALIKSFGWIVIPFPVFIYFQRRLVVKDV